MCNKCFNGLWCLDEQKVGLNSVAIVQRHKPHARQGLAGLVACTHPPSLPNDAAIRQVCERLHEEEQGKADLLLAGSAASGQARRAAAAGDADAGDARRCAAATAAVKKWRCKVA